MKLFGWGRTWQLVKSRYRLLCVLLLAISTLCWSMDVARMQYGNADQLVDGFLFKNAHTIRGSIFPASHTLLFKWPLFWILSLLHNSRNASIILTALVAMITVGIFSLLLYRIDQRPLVFGTVCLGLASVLTLIPAQTLGGVTAPLNMSMLTGRNLEYIEYIGILVLYIRAGVWRSWQWIIASLALAVLGASDLLFMWWSIGGSIVLLGISYIGHLREYAATAKRWLSGSVLGWAGAYLLLYVLGKYAVVITRSGTDSPGFVHDWGAVRSAIPYLLKGLLLNFGITKSNGRWAIIPAAINMAIASGCMYAAYRLIQSMVHTRLRDHGSKAMQLFSMLFATTCAAMTAYVITDHPYQADARYLSIALFTGFLGLVLYACTTQIRPDILFMLSGIFFVGIISGIITTHTFTNRTLANSSLRLRDERIALALQEHPVDVLVGDYWRVYPIKTMTAHTGQNVLPLTGCFEPVSSLRSNAWRVNLLTHSFAYILSSSPSGTPFPICNLRSIEFIYGYPTAITVIAGNADHPSEILLFYSNGASDDLEKGVVPPRPVSGVPTEGRATPTGSTITPLADPS